MITIFDFEDGLQEFIANKLDTETTVEVFDNAGDFNFEYLKRTKKNIIILSKPFDCLQRGVIAGKYPDDNFTLLQDWSRRNWRYTNEEVYNLLSDFILSTTQPLVIHPESLNDPSTRRRIEKYTGATFDWDVNEYDNFYKENINLR